MRLDPGNENVLVRERRNDRQTHMQKRSAFFHVNYYTHHRKEKLANLSRISVKWISIKLQTLMRGRCVQWFLCILSAFVHRSELNSQLIDSELGKALSVLRVWVLSICFNVPRSTIHILSGLHLFHMRALKASYAPHVLEGHACICYPLFVPYVADYPALFTVVKINSTHKCLNLYLFS